MKHVEWGPWINHDGGACPCLGRFVHCRRQGLPDWQGIAGQYRWNGLRNAWTIKGIGRVVQYRIRDPWCLPLLRQIAENPFEADASPATPEAEETRRHPVDCLECAPRWPSGSP